MEGGYCEDDAAVSGFEEGEGGTEEMNLKEEGADGGMEEGQKEMEMKKEG